MSRVRAAADRWFSDPFAMIRDDRIDILTIAVKVPAHREFVLAALEAGKAVYCEAPLGRSVAETEELASAMRSHHTEDGCGRPGMPHRVLYFGLRSLPQLV
jgi:predicted dehydrogenase